jgi:hypothetical protein
MKFLKGLLLSLLNLLFFFAITSLGFAYMMNETLMKPEFTNAEIDKMDIAGVFGDLITAPATSPGQQAFLDSATMNAALKTAIKNAEPELKNEIHTAVFNGYDYFQGRSNSLDISISLNPVQTSLKDVLWADFQKSPSAQVSSIPSSTVQDTFNKSFDQSIKNMPSSIDINSNTFSPDTQKEVQSIKQYIGYYQTYWKLLIPIIILLAVAIILLEHNVKESLRSIGINLLFYALFGLAIDVLLGRFVTPSYSIPGLPPSLNTWFMHLMDDMMAPLNTFTIAVAIFGAVLVIASFFVKKKTETAQ